MNQEDRDELVREAEKIDSQLAGIAREAGSGFRAHFTVYLAVNIFLGILNFITSPQFPWVFFTIAPWAVGVFAHLQSLLNTRKKRKRKLAAQNFTHTQYTLVDRLHHMEARFKQHRNAFLSVNGFLFGTNLITSFAFPWFLFPLGGWAIGFLAHWSSYSAKRKFIIKELKAQGIEWNSLGSDISAKQVVAESSLRSYYQEAASLKQSMIEELKQNKELKLHWGGELEALLTQFTDQIGELVNRNSELNAAIRMVNEEELNQELQNLEVKSLAANDQSLKAEYIKSIEQHRHQLNTIEDLKNKQEINQLRLKSSLLLIKQLKLDSTRLKTLNSIEEPLSLKELRQKSSELGSYLEDFNKSFRELDWDK